MDRNTTHIGKLLVTKAIGKSSHDPKIRVRIKCVEYLVKYFIKVINCAIGWQGIYSYPRYWSLIFLLFKDWEDITPQYKKKEGSKEMKR